ncbi:Uncharacterized protein TPAR_00202 [Tolypocladium paradoxum]|uniref:chitinase n=1 Tax=Tolypocladium paradoxum TaxID=94208 RepID=A0A2S4LB17_9HYPO|nr:Uncharacterized protein TPAR_00202 [Tolypocladium paradoxum]
MRGGTRPFIGLLAALSGFSHVQAIYENAFGQYPDRCPLPCSEVGPHPGSWTRIPRLSALEYCDEPLLFDVNVQNDVGDGARVPIRACSQAESVDRRDLNPRQSRISMANNCGADVKKTTQEAQTTGSTSSARNLSGDNLDAAVGQLASYLERAATCGTTIFFAKAGNVVAGLYSGAEIQHESAIAVLETFRERIGQGDRMLQVCETNVTAAETLGVILSSLDELAKVQTAVKTWTNGECVSSESSESVEVELGLLVSSVTSNGSDASSSRHKRALCRDIRVDEGDSCASLASRCGISGADFTKFNPKSNLCATLRPKQYVCCTAGDLPDHTPQPESDGSCRSYSVRPGDGCWSIAESFGITQTRIEDVNKNTWGWAGCAHLQAEQVICLSSGSPPFPAAVPGTQCGPQVPGTTKPSGNTPWNELNQCPLKSCCSVWGFCGTTAEFCTPTPADTGAPGTAKPGTNGCISNCGTKIVNNGSPPSTFRKVGYFEAWNRDRPCLWMDAKNIDTNAITHVHFAFVTLDADFGISIDEKMKKQWQQFRELGSSVKKIPSFGGWAFSTKPDTLWRFRDATKPANRLKFANNAIAFLNEQGLDGLDFDWEYPGAPDIPGVPPGTAEEATNYLEFLKLVKRRLPAGKELSIALPASFWYLKPYPVAEIAPVVDYFVYMTYDFHGQWDMSNPWATSSCPAGNCLRSHVNKTITEGSLSMITKAGVPASKVLVGVSSYGRSFRMTDSRCVGPMCTYTGKSDSSNAYKGRCTDTAGYISNAEIDEIIKDNPAGYTLRRQIFDSNSESNILIYGTNEKADYVGYMTADVKKSRTDWVKGLNFGGTSDWAVDLMEFVNNDGGGGGGGNDDDKCSEADKTYSSNRPREGQYMRWFLMDPENAAASSRTYITIVNLTPHTFTLRRTSQYQMDEFDWATIPSGRARQNVAVYPSRVGANPVDTNGEAYYDIGNTGKRFEVRVTTHIPDTYPRRIVFDLSGMSKGQREYKVPEQEVPVTLVITGSDSYGFITSLSHGPGNWMNGIKDVIKDRTLKQIVMPGTHDSGMSQISGAILTGATSSNTQTQGLNMYDQLRTGARWFDLRVQTVHQVVDCCDNYEFWTTHVTDEKAAVPMGRSGEKFDDVVDNINKFLNENKGEVIVLQFRYLIGIRNVPSLGPIYWDAKIKDEFFDKLKKIKNRCPNLSSDTDKMDERKVGDLMNLNGGNGCVLIFLDTAHLNEKISSTSDHISSSDGIYSKNDIRWKDGWPDKEDTKDVAEWNVAEWKKSRSNFLVSQWLSSPHFLTSTFSYSLQSIAVLPTNPALYWRGVNDISPEQFPNVIMVDYIGQILMNAAGWSDLGAELYTLAIGLNLYTISENCTISKKRSPLLPSRNRNMRIAQADNPLVSSWNGIIFADGTTIDHPPPGLHPGRPEILRNGTIFSNGTVLEKDIPNPEYTDVAWNSTSFRRF